MAGCCSAARIRRSSAFPKSADAYAHANALVKDDPNLLADYADVLAMTQNRKLSGKPAELIDRALAIDPKHKKALALAATAALEAHDFSAVARLLAAARQRSARGLR